MKIIDGILYIEFSEAVEAGISYRTANRLTSMRDPADRRRGLINYDSLKSKYQELIIRKYGDPVLFAYGQQVYGSPLFVLTPADAEAVDGFLLADGRRLPSPYIIRYKRDARYLHFLANAGKDTARRLGFTGTAQLNAAVRMLIAQDKHTSLPATAKRLNAALRAYRREGITAIIRRHLHRFGNQNRKKITGAVAEWLLATYSLMTKPTVPELYEQYQSIRKANHWPDLDETTIYKWLYRPENRRVWTLARDGEAEYARLFKHYLATDHSRLFPNAHWVIDGTKLDMIHVWNGTLGMAAKLKIDPVFDVYSEKIIGYSISHTESKADHFRALKMAAETAGVRPYLLTYDHQSGHLTAEMQRIYDLIVAEGGTHYPHRVRNHGPAEALFSQLQQKYISKWWFSDRQSPMSRRAQSRVNPDAVRGSKTACRIWPK